MTQKVRPSTLAETSVAAGTYGGGTQTAVFTVDAQGRLVYAGNSSISLSTSQISGTINASQLANNQTYGINISGSAGSAPASDVSAWAKSSTKPSYTKSEIGLGNVDNTADSTKSVNYATTAGNGGVRSVNGQTGAVTLAAVLASDFVLDANQKGGIKLPSGLWIQWGYFANIGVGYGRESFKYPFPSACLGVLVNLNRGAAADQRHAANWNTTGFDCPTDNCNTFWVAFGT